MQAVKGMHYRDMELSRPFSHPDIHSYLDGLLLELGVIDAHYMPEKVDFNWVPIDLSVHYGRLRCVVVGVGDGNGTTKSVCKLLCGFALSKVINIFGCVGPIGIELGNMAIALCPQVERLAPDDKCIVAQFQDAC